MEDFWSGTFWPNVLPVLGSLVLAAAGLAMEYLRRRFKLQVDADADAVMRSTLRSTIIGVEEWAARELKSGKTTPGGADKARRVLNVARSLYPKLQESRLTQLMDEELARVPGAGATGAGHVNAPPAPVEAPTEAEPEEEEPEEDA